MVRKLTLSGVDLSGLSIAAKAFGIVVILPTFLAAVYYGIIASDIYVSESRFALRSSSDIEIGSAIDSFLGTSSGASTNEDDMIVRDHIHSLDMLLKLQARIDVRGHYSSDDIDIGSRLADDATQEAFLEYFEDHVEILTENDTVITTLRIHAFTPEFAQRMAQEIIELSESLVNRLSERITEDTVKFARSEVDMAEERVRKAAGAVTKFRSQSRSIDPQQETAAVLGIVTQLEGNLAAAKAELIEAESFMKPDSVQVKNLRARVDALKAQVQNERQRLTNTEAESNEADFTRLIDNYEPLVLEKTLAEQRYSSALTSLEVARAEAQRKQRYLITFVQPHLPEEAVEPSRFVEIITVFFAALLSYAIGGLVWAAIKDHMRM